MDWIIGPEHSKIHMNLFKHFLDLYWCMKILMAKAMEEVGGLVNKLEEIIERLNILEKLPL